ncbi:hypothetical protein RCL1_003244 [Eukaryota sp. TZLM3-RCL]
MSFREVSTLSHHLRTLGFPQSVYYDSFKVPNFSLVSKILVFLSRRLDPTISIPEDVDTPSDRLFFIKSIVPLVYNSTHVKLNPKNLYSADSDAVAELLKLSNLCYSGMMTSSSFSPPSSDIFELLSSKLEQVKLALTLSADSSSKTVNLLTLIENENESMLKRKTVLELEVEAQKAEETVRNLIGTSRSTYSTTLKTHQSLLTEIESIESKIQSKMIELERAQKRFEGLKTVRPSFMDEYEKVQEELRIDYEYHVTLLRNLHYYQSQVNSLILTENDAIGSQIKQLRKLKSQNRQENLRHMREVNGEDDDNLIGSDDESGVDDGSLSLNDVTDDSDDGNFQSNLIDTPGQNEMIELSDDEDDRQFGQNSNQNELFSSDDDVMSEEDSRPFQKVDLSDDSVDFLDQNHDSDESVSVNNDDILDSDDEGLLMGDSLDEGL